MLSLLTLLGLIELGSLAVILKTNPEHGIDLALTNSAKALDLITKVGMKHGVSRS